MKLFIPILATLGYVAAAPSGIGFVGYAPTKSDIAQLLQSTREIVAQANAIPGLKVVRTGEATPLGILETTDIGLGDQYAPVKYQTYDAKNVQLPGAEGSAIHRFKFGIPETYEGQLALLKSADALVKTIDQIPGLKVVRTGEKTPLGLLEQSDIALDRKKRDTNLRKVRRVVKVPKVAAYAEPAPAYAQPAPAYAQPAPAYAQPAPAYEKPATGYSAGGAATLSSLSPLSGTTTSLIPGAQDINDLLNGTKNLVKMVNDIPGLKVVRTDEYTPLGVLEETNIAIDTRAATKEGSTYPYTFTVPTSPEAKEALLASTDALVETVNLIEGLKVVRTGEMTPLGLLEKSNIALPKSSIH